MYTAPWYKHLLVIASAAIVGITVGWATNVPFTAWLDEFGAFFAVPLGGVAGVVSLVWFAWWWRVAGFFRDDTAIGAMILARCPQVQAHPYYESIVQRAAVGRAQCQRLLNN
jgi:hypothetical protein